MRKELNKKEIINIRKIVLQRKIKQLEEELENLKNLLEILENGDISKELLKI